MTKTTYKESGMTVEFLNGKHFQLQNCKSYQNISGQNVKEMDFGVLNDIENNATIYLIELKQFYCYANAHFVDIDPVKPDIIQKYVEVFRAKLCHSVSMLSQNRSNTQCCASGIKGFNFEKNTIKAIFVLNLDGKQKDLAPFQKELENNTKDLKAIFRLDAVRVMLYDDAKELLSEWFK